MLVCKRWRRVLLSEPTLWRAFAIGSCSSSLPIASELALLQRVGSLVASLTLESEVSGKQLNTATACLQPQQLQALEVWEPSQQLIAALPRFSRLTSLDLGTWHHDLPAGTAAAITQLNQLCGLSLGSDHMPHAVIAAVLTCTQLRKLHVEYDSIEQPQALRQLTALHQLTSLELEVLAADEEGCLHPPEAALFPALQTYRFSVECSETSDSLGVQVRDVGMLVKTLVCWPACMCSLACLVQVRCMLRLPSHLSSWHPLVSPCATVRCAGGRLRAAVLQLRRA